MKDKKLTEQEYNDALKRLEELTKERRELEIQRRVIEVKIKTRENLVNELGEVLQKIADEGYDLSNITGWTHITDEDDEMEDENYIPPKVTGLQCAVELFEWLEED